MVPGFPVFVCGLCKEEASPFWNKSSSYITLFIHCWGRRGGISRCSAADARATTTSKQPSQLWRWSSTFMWRPMQVDSNLKKKARTENPILCGIGGKKEWEKGKFGSFFMNQFELILSGDGSLLTSGCGVLAWRIKAGRKRDPRWAER